EFAGGVVALLLHHGGFADGSGHRGPDFGKVRGGDGFAHQAVVGRRDRGVAVAVHAASLLHCCAMRDPNPWSDRVDRVRDWPGQPVARSRLPGSIHEQYRQSEDGDAGIADQCSGRFSGSSRLVRSRMLSRRCTAARARSRSYGSDQTYRPVRRPPRGEIASATRRGVWPAVSPPTPYRWAWTRHWPRTCCPSLRIALPPATLRARTVP